VLRRDFGRDRRRLRYDVTRFDAGALYHAGIIPAFRR
jgi:hypothetical protein